jgi:hypothetical protein
VQQCDAKDACTGVTVVRLIGALPEPIQVRRMTSAGFRTRFPDARLVLRFVLSKNVH